IKTPQHIIDAVAHGMSNWIDCTDPSLVRPYPFGSLLTGDILLPAAFTEQYHSIGWYQLLLGQISCKCASAFIQYKGPATNTKAAQQ
ncbi:MAG: hypothetical protein ACK53Y_04740, partial [bacterium]